MPVEPAQAAAWVHFSLLTTWVAVQTQKYVTPDDIERVLKVLEPAIDGLVKAGYKDRLFVYGFDEQTDSWAKSLYRMYGAIKQRWPFLRTMATLDWQASSPGWSRFRSSRVAPHRCRRRRPRRCVAISWR